MAQFTRKKSQLDFKANTKFDAGRAHKPRKAICL